MGVLPCAQAQAQQNHAPPTTLQNPATAAPSDLWTRSTLFGDMGGLRPWLNTHGVTLGLQETSEYMRNFSGGTHRIGTYHGMAQLSVGIDTDQAFGLPGGTFYASGLQIRGTDLSTRSLQVIQTATGAEANAGTRLWELWYQQAMLDDKIDLKIGQQALDQEFMVSDYAGTFMNATFGWSALPAADLPSGGPAYPLSSLGVRVRAHVADDLTVLAGVFDGNPAPGSGDPQALNSSGTRFPLHNGALLIGEVQYAINQDAHSPGLPGSYKLGFWYHTSRFDDQARDDTGLSLANPASTGTPASHRGNYSFYAVADQMVWRPNADAARSLGAFARVMGAPGDRNLIDLGITAGLTLKAPFDGREDDVAGLAVGYARISSHAREWDRNQALYIPHYPSRSAETLIEATYQYQVTPWWMMQADVQYVMRPGGGVPSADNPSRRIGNETILGMRTVLTF